MNILMPLEKTSAEQLINNNMALNGGHYIFGANRHWHGGMHFTSTKKVQAIADGTLIAYRTTEDYLSYSYDKNGSTVDSPYSNNFALIKHQFKSPKGAELTYYSLYMHLLPANYLEADKNKAIPSFLQAGTGSEAEAIVNSNEDPQGGLNLRSTETGGIRAFAPFNSSLQIVQPPADYKTNESYSSFFQNNNSDSNWQLVQNGSNDIFQAYMSSEQVAVEGNSATVTTNEDYGPAGYGLRIRECGPGGKVLQVAKKGDTVKVVLDESATWLQVTEINGEPAPENSYICSSRERLKINPHEVDHSKATGSVICPNLAIEAGACLGYPGHHLDQKNCLHFEIFSDDSLINFMNNPYNEGEGSLLKIPAGTLIYKRESIPVETSGENINELTGINVTNSSESGNFVEVTTTIQAGLLKHADLAWHKATNSYTITSNLESYRKYWGSSLTAETHLTFISRCDQQLSLTANNPEYRLASTDLAEQKTFWINKEDLNLLEISGKGSFLKTACNNVYCECPEQYSYQGSSDITSDDVVLSVTDCVIACDANDTGWVNAQLPKQTARSTPLLSFAGGASWPKQNSGWVKEEDCQKLSPYDWPGFKVMSETGSGGKDAYIDISNLNSFFREILDTIDENGNGIISYHELNNAYKNPTINKRLAYTIAKHPTEWDVDESVSKWSHLETWFESSESFENTKEQIRNLSFIQDVDSLNDPDTFHIHPLSFILQLKEILKIYLPIQKIKNSQDDSLKDLPESKLIWFNSEKMSENINFKSKSTEFKKHLTIDFKRKVIQISNDLNINPNYLMAAMALETGYTFSPSITNSIGATGLIQFTKTTAKKVLKTTTGDLSQLTAVEQLDYVKKYLVKNKVDKVRNVGDLYLCIFSPAYVGKSEDFILYSSPDNAYLNNRGLDSNSDSKISKEEITKKINLIMKIGKEYAA
ncbi:hypothetical protein [Reinekea marinisedimentorum]|uniref:EF-hand domain-containing protein n=1 Tax=Reinekea marinisedimentorum TaxID=230495 RepID=A0A4R3I7M2_9GAMM|nr:hypothetical protein [Reinekea marinisedimentorum]TCS41285.1 hypothetical protein BCF53_10616 [Reinekea marinisedimentorum]